MTRCLFQWRCRLGALHTHVPIESRSRLAANVSLGLALNTPSAGGTIHLRFVGADVAGTRREAAQRLRTMPRGGDAALGNAGGVGAD
jgi:hypothetical protein